MTPTGLLDLEFWVRALDSVASAFEEAEVRLCGYDGIIGDGDHGTSMRGGFREALKSLAGAAAADSGELFCRTGQAFMENVGGVTGVVFGSMFDAAGQAAAGRAGLDAAALYLMFAAGLSAAMKRGKAAPGDKSMIDALSPAVEALRAAAERGEPAPAALGAAANAAEAGMESTIPMEAKVGRARYQPRKGAGHVDAGAASVCLLFQVLARAAARNEPTGSART
jgi:phosphoenolpyruvate---glycerone phosphotransferase subunit DhaL